MYSDSRDCIRSCLRRRRSCRPVVGQAQFRRKRQPAHSDRPRHRPGRRPDDSHAEKSRPKRPGHTRLGRFLQRRLDSRIRSPARRGIPRACRRGPHVGHIHAGRSLIPARHDSRRRLIRTAADTDGTLGIHCRGGKICQPCGRRHACRHIVRARRSDRRYPGSAACHGERTAEPRRGGCRAPSVCRHSGPARPRGDSLASI